MKVLLMTGALFSCAVPAAGAESLDIGGIELQLGQKADNVLRLLSSYQVQYSGGSWVVGQKVGSAYEFLGTVGAMDNVVTSISKSFQMTEPEAAPDIYTSASNELHRRGGSNCSTREVAFTDGLIRGFETQCGVYTLTYYMPSKTDGGVRVLGGVAISIRSQ